jgi:glycosyltransferase involved in cell wall biosynthesis
MNSLDRESMMRPLFSVVIPTYNRAELLPRAIDSVLNQTFADFEVIVVDDGSTDRTRDVVSDYSDHRVGYIRIEHSGVGAARNAGAKKASGEWLVFLDSDDQALPNWLETAHDVVGNGDVELFCCAVQVVDATGKPRMAKAPVDHGPLFGNLTANFLAGSCFIRRTLFEQIGGYRRELSYGENFEMGVRVSARLKHQPHRIHTTSEVLVRAYEHGAQRGSDTSPAKFDSLEQFITLHMDSLKNWPAELARCHRWAGIAALGIEDHEAARRHIVCSMKSGSFEWKDPLRFLLTIPGLRWANPYRLAMPGSKNRGKPDSATRQPLRATILSGSPKSTPFFSVVIPTFNRRRLLERALESVFAQTFEDFEIIVVDDYSTDGTYDWLLSLKEPRIRALRNTGPKGAAAARNVGISAATGNWIAFLDSDDQWQAGKLERFAEAISAQPKIQVWYSGYKQLGLAANGAAGPDLCEGFTGDHLPRLRRLNPIGALPAVVASRSVLLQVGGFDESLYHREDMDLYYRLARVTPFGFIPHVLTLVDYRPTDRVTASMKHTASGWLGFYRKHKKDLSLRDRLYHQKRIFYHAVKAKQPAIAIRYAVGALVQKVVR